MSVAPNNPQMDIIKHRSLFDPAAVAGRVGVVGVGALGSALALQLAKLGLTNLVLWDHDTVEGHNLPNQILYGPAAIGQPKVVAARAAIANLTGYTPTVEVATLSEKQQLRDHAVSHLFVCVDSMAARESIFRRAVHLNPQLTFYCEGRMNAREGSRYAFDPRDTARAKAYLRDAIYPDDQVEVIRGTCGNILSLGATANMLACMMTWALIDHYTAGKAAEASAPADEISADLSRMTVHHTGSLLPTSVRRVA